MTIYWTNIDDYLIIRQVREARMTALLPPLLAGVS